MARLTALPTGQPWQFFADTEDFLSRTPDPSATLFVDFDESTNAALAADIVANMGAYSVPAQGTLNRNGVAVTIATANALYSLQQSILNGVSDSALKAAIVALWNGAATTQQQQKALAYALLKLHQADLI